MVGDHTAELTDEAGAQTAAITVTDAGTLSETVTAVSGAEHTAIALNVLVSDSNTSDATLTTTLTVTDGLTTAGGNTGSTVTLTGTAAQINAALATACYTGGSNFYGSDSLSVTTTDATSGSSVTKTAGITIADESDEAFGPAGVAGNPVGARGSCFSRETSDDRNSPGMIEAP